MGGGLVTGAPPGLLQYASPSATGNELRSPRGQEGSALQTRPPTPPVSVQVTPPAAARGRLAPDATACLGLRCPGDGADRQQGPAGLAHHGPDRSAPSRGPSAPRPRRPVGADRGSRSMRPLGSARPAPCSPWPPQPATGPPTAASIPLGPHPARHTRRNTHLRPTPRPKDRPPLQLSKATQPLERQADIRPTSASGGRARGRAQQVSRDRGLACGFFAVAG